MKTFKVILQSLTIGIFFFIILVPFIIIRGYIPYLITLGIFILSLIFNRKNQLRLFIIGLPISLVLFLSVSFFIFINEQLFKLGPYYPSSFDGNLIDYTMTDSLTYKTGSLEVYSKDKNSYAILVYRENNEIIWAEKLDSECHTSCYTYDIHLREVHYGFIRDILTFSPQGYGEPGHVFIWKNGDIHRFYIEIM